MQKYNVCITLYNDLVQYILTPSTKIAHEGCENYTITRGQMGNLVIIFVDNRSVLDSLQFQTMLLLQLISITDNLNIGSENRKKNETRHC